MPALPLPDPALNDGVVALRPWRQDDVPVVASWGRDPVIVRWTGVPAEQSANTARAYAIRAEEARRAGLMVALAIADAAADELLGSCDIRRQDPADPAIGELGYLLRAEARGRLVATRAIWLLTDWAFRNLAMERIQALVHPDNPASARVLKRLGFTREGLLRRYRSGAQGREDRVLYAVLPGELVAIARITGGG